jgi:DNA-binding beta-propeller fold protein YncE
MKIQAAAPFATEVRPDLTVKSGPTRINCSRSLLGEPNRRAGQPSPLAGSASRLDAVAIEGLFGVYRRFEVFLSHPSSVAVDSAGNLYVIDFGNDRVVKLPVQ